MCAQVYGWVWVAGKSGERGREREKNRVIGFAQRFKLGVCWSYKKTGKKEQICYCGRKV